MPAPGRNEARGATEIAEATDTDENHPFGKQQYVVMGLTTRTRYDEQISLAESDHRRRSSTGEFDRPTRRWSTRTGD